MQMRLKSSLQRLHRLGPYKKERKNKNPLGFGIPFAKGVVLKTVIRKPKKPNSANRKCVVVRLSSGKEVVAFVPGEYCIFYTDRNVPDIKIIYYSR